MALRRPTFFRSAPSGGAPRAASFSAHALSVLAPSCAAIALLATAFFFFLHHVGNQLPYDLAVERFAAELASAQPDEGHAKGYKSTFEYCEMSGAVLAGARGSATAGSALRSAVVLKELKLDASGPYANAGARLPLRLRSCLGIKVAVNGGAVPAVVLKTRYWFGGKALYAIALRYGSVREIREFTRWGTRIAYVLLAISLLLLSPKMLLLAAPVVVFGAFFSGIDYWADVANGFPYLWTVLFAAGLALLTRRDVRVGGSAWWSGTVPVYCFAAGTVSTYLWMGDGHTLLVVVWIGMVVWFGWGLGPRRASVMPPAKSQSVTSSRAARTKRAALCIVLYGAGIVICYVLGQAVKAMFLGYERVVASFWFGLAGSFWHAELPGMSVTQTRDATDLSAFLTSFYAVYWPGWLPAHTVGATIAVFALLASLGLAVFEARRGRRDLLWSTLWIVGLMSIGSVTFLIADHSHYRTARFVFVPLALCLSCLVLCARSVDWRASLATRWELPLLLVVAGCVSWQLARNELSAVTKIIDSVEDVQPIIRSHYDVYLDGKRLVYVREECGDEDDDARFFLDLHPVDVADLPDDRQPHGFDNLDFLFLMFGFRDRRCAALRILPDYALAAIRTGQYVPGEGRLWSSGVDLGIIDSVEDVQPIIRSHYDVYLDGKRLVYVREECGDEDDDATFFLHLHPVDVADLPDSRQPHGFDNLDFDFLTFGFRDQRCTALLILPDYALAAIHTGQYVHGGGRLWEQRVDVESLQPGSARGLPLARESLQPGSARGAPLASESLE